MTQAGDAIFTDWVGMEPEQITRDLGFLRAFKVLDTDDVDQLLTFGELLVAGKRKARPAQEGDGEGAGEGAGEGNVDGAGKGKEG